MNGVKKTVVGLTVVGGLVALFVMFYSKQDGDLGAPPKETAPTTVSGVGVAVPETRLAPGTSQAKADVSQSTAQSETPLFKSFPELNGMPGPQRMAYLTGKLTEKTDSYLSRYKSPVEAMTDLVRLGKNGDIGATLAAQRLANRCADAAEAVQAGRKPFGITIEECQSMSKDDLNAIPALMIAAANSGDALAKYAVMNYSNHASGAAYMQTFLHDPRLLASFQEETRKAQLYFEPLATEAVLGNISQTYKMGSVLPADPVMEQAYKMAAYTMAATHVPAEGIAYRLTGPNSIGDADSKLTVDQRNAALRAAQTILNRCCSATPLPLVLLQPKR